MKNNDGQILFIIIIISLLYFYNNGTIHAVRGILLDRSYRTNFGAVQGTKIVQTSPDTNTGSIFDTIATGIQDIIGIAGLFA